MICCVPPTGKVDGMKNGKNVATTLVLKLKTHHTSFATLWCFPTLGTLCLVSLVLINYIVIYTLINVKQKFVIK